MKRFFITLVLLVFISTLAVAQKSKLAILFSISTEKINSEKAIDRITYWELFFINNKIDYSVIYEDELESGISVDEYHSLLLPNVLSISGEGIDELKKYINNSGSVFISGEFATYSEEQKWIGWKNFESLLGVKVLGNLESSQGTRKINVLESQPFVNEINLESNYAISTINRPIVVSKISDDVLPFIEIESYSSTNIKIDSALAVFTSYGKGKIFWSSCDPDAFITGSLGQKHLEKVYLNIFNWLSNKSTAWIDLLPSKYKNQLFQIIDLSNGLDKYNKNDDLLNQTNSSTSFVISSSETNFEKLKKFSAIGELILKFPDSYFDSMKSNRAFISVLDKTIRIFENQSGVDIKTVFIGDSNPDEEVIMSFVKLGINNFICSSISPEIAQIQKKRDGVLFIPISDESVISSGKQLNDVLNGSNKFIRFVYIEPRISCSEIKSSKPNLISTTSKKNIYNSIDDLRKWITFRSKIKLESKRISKNLYEIILNDIPANWSSGIEIGFIASDLLLYSNIEVTSNDKKLDYYFDSRTGALKIKLNSLIHSYNQKIKLNVKF